MIFEGDYKQDLRTGHGTHRFANGDVFEGEWETNVVEGDNVIDIEGNHDEEVVTEGRGTIRFVDGSVMTTCCETGPACC